MQILGVYIDQPFLRLALVEKTRKQKEILSLKSLLCSELENVKRLYNLSSKGKIASALATKYTLVRPFHVNVGNSEHLEQIIAFQSDAVSHFNTGEVLSVPLILKKDPKQTSSLLFTTPREKIREHLEILDKWQLDPDFVTASAMALIRYAQWKNPDLESAFLVDLGSEEWTCVCMENGELKKSYSISGGIESLLSALWEDRKKNLFPKEITGVAKQIDLLQLQTPLNTHLAKALHDMRQELSRIIFSFFRLYGQKPIFFTGRIQAFGQMKEYLTEHLKEWINTDTDWEMQKEESLYAIPIGLAVGAQDKMPEFRKEEFFSSKNWKRAGFYSLALILCSFSLAAGIIGFSQSVVHSKTGSMFSHLKELLSESDPSLLPKIFKSSELEDVLHLWNRAVTVYSKDYPYILQTPKVSEILSWLYQHPLIIELGKEKDPLEIQNIEYRLLRYPHIDAPKDPYLAKIELSFTTKSALNARKFHEMLLKGEGLIDASQEIQWEASDHLYRTSFFLKAERS